MQRRLGPLGFDVPSGDTNTHMLALLARTLFSFSLLTCVPRFFFLSCPSFVNRPRSLLKYAAIIDDAELVKKLVKEGALTPWPCTKKGEIEKEKAAKNAENKQILTACVTFNNMQTLEALLQPVMQKLSMADDSKFFEQLLANTAQGAPKILGAILRRVNPEQAFYSKFVRQYVQLIVLHFDAQDEEEEFRGFIWKSEWPLHAALLCSRLCRVLSLQQKLYEASFKEHEAKFEDMAVRMLEACKDQLEASMVLTERANAKKEESTPMHYAMKYARKTFVAHRFFQKAYTKLWYVHSAEAAAYEVATRRGAVGPIEDLFTRPVRPKWAMSAAGLFWRWCRSLCCAAKSALGAGPAAVGAHGAAPADGGGGGGGVVMLSERSDTMRRVNTSANVLGEFTDNALAYKEEQREEKLRRASSSADFRPLSQASIFATSDDAGQMAAAAGMPTQPHSKVKFVAESMWERALNVAWTTGVFLVMLVTLVLMTPFRALAPVCPPLERLTRRWLDNNEFDCAFFKVVVYNSLHMVYVVYFVMYTLSDIFSWRGVGSFTEPDVMERVLLVWSVGFFLGNGTIVELLLP